jgi:hypothetical protein
MKRSRLVPVILAFALIGGGFLRGAGIIGKRALGMDEGISYLAATGHEGEYIDVINTKYAPYGSWVKASEWKRFIRSEDLFCFKKISYDLAHYDVHPPLYFWILHIWFMIFGASISSGPLLNIALFIPSVLILFGLARFCLKNAVEAALVALIWATSPAVIRISFVSRNYCLLVLLSIIFAWEILRLSDLTKKMKWPDYVLLFITSGSGILTHYHFLLLMAGAVLFLILRLFKKNKRRLATALSLMGLGCLLLFILHPDFYLSFLLEQFRDHSVQYRGFLPRMNKVAIAFFDFIIGNRVIQRVLMIIFIAIVIPFLIIRVRDRRRWIKETDGIHFTGLSIIYYFIWTGGTITLLYLIGVTSLQQMGSRYLSMVYPFLAFVTVIFFRFFGRAKVIVSTCFCVLIFISSGMMVWRYNNTQKQIFDPAVLLHESKKVLIDNDSRLFIPPLLPHIPDDIILFIARQDFLLTHRNDWLNNLGKSSVYISRGYKEEKGGQKNILKVISQKYEIREVDGAGTKMRKIFKVKPRVYPE